MLAFNRIKHLEKISLDDALMLFKLPRKVGDFNGNEITANNGRFGPYIKYANSFVSIPKNISPFEIDIEMAIDLIKEKEKANMPIHEYKNFPVTKKEREDSVHLLNGIISYLSM